MKTLFTFCFFFFTLLLHGQEIKFSFEKQRILLGEPLLMKIEGIVTKGSTNDIFSIDTLPHFEILHASGIDTVAMAGNQLKLTQTLTLTSWDSGRWNMPTLVSNGVASKGVNVDVGYTSPWNPSQPYHDIKGIMPVKNPGQSTWWWYVIGLAVLVALFLLFFPGGKKEVDPSGLDSNAYKKALQQLEDLQKKQLGATQPKQYYTELVNIFRTYLKGAKGIQSFSKTTSDLSIRLQALKMPDATYNQLVQNLRLSDLVKFAQYKPEAAIHTNAFETIKQSITTIEQSNAV